MNRAQLKQGLQALGVPDEYYFLDGVDNAGPRQRDIGETVLSASEDGAGWYTFVAERGQRHNLRLHSTESEACDVVWGHLSALIRRPVETITPEEWERADQRARQQVADYERWVASEGRPAGS